MKYKRWMRESDAPQGDRDGVVLRHVGWEYHPTVRCPLCGAAVEIGRNARTMGDDGAYDECPECGVQVRVVIEWREAVYS